MSESRLLVEVLGRRKFPGHGVAGELESLRGDLSVVSTKLFRGYRVYDAA